MAATYYRGILDRTYGTFLSLHINKKSQRQIHQNIPYLRHVPLKDFDNWDEDDYYPGCTFIVDVYLSRIRLNALWHERLNIMIKPVREGERIIDTIQGESNIKVTLEYGDIDVILMILEDNHCIFIGDDFGYPGMDVTNLYYGSDDDSDDSIDFDPGDLTNLLRGDDIPAAAGAA